MAKRFENKSNGVIHTLGTNLTGFYGGKFRGCKATEEQLLSWGFTEIVEPVYEPVELPIEQRYKNLVIEKIRLQYSIDDELAILRQKETKPSEFASYNSYCEQCKSEARAELGYNESEEG